MFAGSLSRLYRSGNAGAQWTRTKAVGLPDDEDVTAIAVSATNASTLFVATYDLDPFGGGTARNGHLYKSSDAGATLTTTRPHRRDAHHRRRHAPDRQARLPARRRLVPAGPRERNARHHARRRRLLRERREDQWRHRRRTVERSLHRPCERRLAHGAVGLASHVPARELRGLPEHGTAARRSPSCRRESPPPRAATSSGRSTVSFTTARTPARSTRARRTACTAARTAARRGSAR